MHVTNTSKTPLGYGGVIVAPNGGTGEWPDSAAGHPAIQEHIAQGRLIVGGAEETATDNTAQGGAQGTEAAGEGTSTPAPEAPAPAPAQPEPAAKPAEPATPAEPSTANKPAAKKVGGKKTTDFGGAS